MRALRYFAVASVVALGVSAGTPALAAGHGLQVHNDSAGTVGARSGAPAGGGHLESAVVPASGTVTNTTSVPNFSVSYTTGGTNYVDTLAGNLPTSGGTTTIPTSITPIKVVLSDGSFTYPAGALTSIKGSALFKNGNFSSGTTQYSDANQRAEFWNLSGFKSSWHTLLGQPPINPLVTLHIPAGHGSVEHVGSATYLDVDINAIGALLRKLAAKKPATGLTLFIGYQVWLYSGSPSGAGIGGYHSMVANGTGRHTYAWASWNTGDKFGAGSADTWAASHEIAEWNNDPNVNDKAPRWSVAGEPQYGCNSAFEVGDPLVGHTQVVGGLHMQDEAGISWFARLVPSIEQNGAYSFFGTFGTFSTAC